MHLRAVNVVGAGGVEPVTFADGSQAFGATGSVASFVVPATVTQLGVDLIGGAGGGGGDDLAAIFAANDRFGGAGGQPGRWGSSLVTAGESLSVAIGAGGGGGVNNFGNSTFSNGGAAAPTRSASTPAAPEAGDNAGGAGAEAQPACCSGCILLAGGGAGGGGADSASPARTVGRAAHPVQRSDAVSTAGRPGATARA
ncbi:MAG: hypothetical protein R2702_11210 [Acidimicrobiales bacterium]